MADYIFIGDKTSNILNILSIDNEEAQPYFSAAYEKELKDANNTFEFSMPADHKAFAAGNVVLGNMVLVRDLDGNLMEYRITEVEDLDADGIEKLVNCEAGPNELAGVPIRPTELSAYTINQAIDYLTANSRYERGRTEWAGSRTIKIEDYTNAKEMLHKLPGIYEGGEVVFRAELDENNRKVIHRYVDYVERIGKDTGKVLEKGKDIESLKRKGDSIEVITALIGIGKAGEDGEYITFRDLDLPGSPAGQDWIGDADALERWGTEGRHIFGYYIYEGQDEEVDPQKLYDLTKNALEKRINALYTYEIEGVDLERMLGYSHEKVRLGDTIRVKNIDLQPPLYVEARVIKEKRSVGNADEDKFTLGDYVPLITEPNEIIQRIQNTLLKNSEKWNSSTKMVRANVAPDDKTVLWIDTSSIPNIPKTYNYNSSKWEDARATTAAQIGAETPSGAQSKANTAEANAEAAAAVDATTKANQAETDANTYTQGYAETPGGAQTKANKAESNAKTYAANQAAAAENSAKQYVVQYAEKKVYKGAVKPDNGSNPIPTPGDLWLDESSSPSVWKQLQADGLTWLSITRSAFSEISGQINTQQLLDDAITKAKMAEQAVGQLQLENGAVGTNQLAALAVTDEKVIRLSDQKVSIGSGTSFASNYNPTTKETPTGAQSKATAAQQAAENNAQIFTEGYAETPGGAQTKATAAKNAAISAAATDATSKANAAETSAKTYAEPALHIGSTAPADTTKKWLDNSGSIYILKAYNGSTWVKATATTASEIQYSSGATVDSLRPAAAGADVTGQNTAADTSKVNGTAASTVKSQASAGQAAQNKITADVGAGAIETTSGSQSKATTAKTEALAAAATDATTKANAAENNAIDYTKQNTGNLVDNATATGELGRWYSTYPLRVDNQDFFGATVPVLESETASNAQNYSENFSIDPSKAYLVSAWIKKSTAEGSLYLGAYFYDDITGSTMVPVDTVRNSTGYLAQVASTNPYFWSGGGQTEWVQVIAYVMPSGTDPSTLKGIGEIPVSGSYENNMIMRSDVKAMKIRFLNWSNTNVNKVWVANVKVVEVDPNAVIKGADGIGKANTAQSTANTANSTANAANNQVNLWKYSNTTYIDGGDLYNNSITTNKIAAGQVTTALLAALAITTDKIAAGAINASKIAANSIQTSHIAAAGIDAGVIKTGVLEAIDITGVNITGSVFRSEYERTDGITTFEGSMGLSSDAISFLDKNINNGTYGVVQISNRIDSAQYKLRSSREGIGSREMLLNRDGLTWIGAGNTYHANFGFKVDDDLGNIIFSGDPGEHDLLGNRINFSKKISWADDLDLIGGVEPYTGDTLLETPEAAGITMDRYGNFMPKGTSGSAYWGVWGYDGHPQMRFYFDPVQATESLKDINMNNHNLMNVNHITINDPGGGEGIEWLGGNGWNIVEAPFGGNSNGSGFLHIKKGTKSVLDFGFDASDFVRSPVIFDRTYTFSSNMYITGSSVIGRITSSRKYKIDEQAVDLETAYKLLNVQPKTWYDKNASESYARAISEGLDLEKEDIPYIERVPGVVAEDVEAAGLSQYVTYSLPDETGNREITGVMYDRLPTLLISLVKDLHERLKAVEGKQAA
jgi:phage minor structural protein